jgi:hypothetical protein
MMGRPIEGESYQVQVNEETLKKVAEILGIPGSHDQIYSIYIGRRPMDQIPGTSSGGGGSASP